MNLSDCYKIIEVTESASDEEIKKSFKKLAHKYHPDKNQQRVKWATEAMSILNKAYTMLMEHRFRDIQKNTNYNNLRKQKPENTRKPQKKTKKIKKKYYNPYENVSNLQGHDVLTKNFVKIRESVKDELYKYFQYGIYNISRREKISNKNIFNNIVSNLKRDYHSLNYLKNKTDDKEFIHHFDLFSSMIYNFYMASECVNIIDSYSNAIEVEAYKYFKKGDDTLHPSEKEIFFDRHNRGFFKIESAKAYIFKSENHFRNALKQFPNSTWTVESKIKLKYTLTLKEYLNLFFSEDHI